MVGLVLGKFEVGRGWSLMVEFGLSMARVGRDIRSARSLLLNIQCW